MSSDGRRPSGPLFVAVVVSTVLSGVFTVQTRQYLSRFPKDPQWLKWMVVVIWILDMLHQSLACYSIHHYNIANFGNVAPSRNLIWSLPALHTIEPIIAVLVQFYFCRQLFRLNRRMWPLVLLAAVLAVVSFCTAEALSIYTYLLRDLIRTHTSDGLEQAWLISCAACDTSLSLGIAWSLWKSRSGVRSTDRIITKLVVWTVSTGALPAIVAEVELLTFMLPINPFIPIAFDIVLAKLYTNSLLAFLNRRHSDADNKFQPPLTHPDILMTTFELGSRTPDVIIGHAMASTSTSQQKPQAEKGSDDRSTRRGSAISFNNSDSDSVKQSPDKEISISGGIPHHIPPSP